MQTTHVAEEAATMPHDSLVLRVHSLGSDEGSMTINELTVLCTTLSKKVETLESDLKQTKLTYGAAYTKLIMKVKNLEHKLKSSKARKRIDEDGGNTLVQMSTQTQGRHEHHFKESDFKFIAPEEDYTAEPDISTVDAEVSTSSPEVKTAAESLVYIRRSAVKRKDKARTFNTEEWDNIQAQIEADEEIAHRNRKFAKQRAEQRRNKPMTQAQQRTYTCNYIKNMGSYTLKQLKKLSFDEVNKLFETTIKRVNTFTPMESDDTVPKAVDGSSKIDAEQELNQESSKRKKIGEGLESAKESKDELS
ncbi:hypothetical protein Tco_0699644 [Tanacetum coccineum]